MHYNVNSYLLFDLNVKHILVSFEGVSNEKLRENRELILLVCDTAHISKPESIAFSFQTDQLLVFLLHQTQIALLL
jgi:hypothetical protein